MKYHQGFFNPNNPNKYAGDVKKIVYRSGLEKSYMHSFDNNPNILEWNSEEIVIPYYHHMDNRQHRYFTDFYLKIKDKKGNIIKYVIEVKPLFQTIPPKPPKKKAGKVHHMSQKKFRDRIDTYLKNQAKWNAAKKFCEENNMVFKILTEKDLQKS